MESVSSCGNFRNGSCDFDAGKALCRVRGTTKAPSCMLKDGSSWIADRRIGVMAGTNTGFAARYSEPRS